MPSGCNLIPARSRSNRGINFKFYNLMQKKCEYRWLVRIWANCQQRAGCRRWERMRRTMDADYDLRRSGDVCSEEKEQIWSVGWGICGWLTSHWPAKYFEWLTSQSHLDQSRISETINPYLYFLKKFMRVLWWELFPKNWNNVHPVCETTIYIPCDDFKIHEI